MGLTRTLIGILFTGAMLSAQSPEAEVKDAVQRLFDAMAAHDAAAIRAAMTGDARLIAVGADGKVNVTTANVFATRIGDAKPAYLERMWEPTILLRGSIAQLWAPYDFHLDGKFSHCGIDSFSLVKMEGAWKITGISYTRETANCPASPLGPVH